MNFFLTTTSTKFTIRKIFTRSKFAYCIWIFVQIELTRAYVSWKDFFIIFPEWQVRKTVFSCCNCHLLFRAEIKNDYFENNACLECKQKIIIYKNVVDLVSLCSCTCSRLLSSYTEHYKDFTAKMNSFVVFSCGEYYIFL